jgi:hypothetical protein
LIPALVDCSCEGGTVVTRTPVLLPVPVETPRYQIVEAVLEELRVCELCGGTGAFEVDLDEVPQHEPATARAA